VREPPEGAEVVYFDEKWTCKVKPYGGRSWEPKGEPRKVPAKHKVKGRLEVFASLDVRTGEVRVRCMRRRRAREVKRFLVEERHRARAQGKDLYVILDNFGSHRALRGWEGRQRGPGRLHLVWLPIQSPWLNLVERFFLDLQRDVLDNSDFPGVRELGRAIYRYVEWWNRHHARPYAPGTVLANTVA